MYELNAVLIHRGVSAYSGHYIAHVRDARTSDWYKFNDEEIEKMEGKKLQLGTEEDIGEHFYSLYWSIPAYASRYKAVDSLYLPMPCNNIFLLWCNLHYNAVM